MSANRRRQAALALKGVLLGIIGSLAAFNPSAFMVLVPSLAAGFAIRAKEEKDSKAAAAALILTMTAIASYGVMSESRWAHVRHPVQPVDGVFTAYLEYVNSAKNPAVIRWTFSEHFITDTPLPALPPSFDTAMPRSAGSPRIGRGSISRAADGKYHFSATRPVLHPVSEWTPTSSRFVSWSGLGYTNGAHLSPRITQGLLGWSRRSISSHVPLQPRLDFRRPLEVMLNYSFR